MPLLIALILMVLAIVALVPLSIVMRDGGRIAYPNGVEPEPKPRRGFRIQSYDAEAGPREFAQLGRAVEQARLRVPIAATYPLGKAAGAHRRLQEKVIGRLVLRIRGPR